MGPYVWLHAMKTHIFNLQQVHIRVFSRQLFYTKEESKDIAQHKNNFTNKPPKQLLTSAKTNECCQVIKIALR